MADFNVRSDSVNVEQIMEQIRARIREKRGVDYTEQQIRELAAVKLEKFLDPRGVRSGLLEAFRKNPPEPEPNYAFEAETLFESHRAPVRWIRKLLRPILKLFWNPNPLIRALHIQAKLNTHHAELEASRHALYYELIHNLVVEATRLGIEVNNLKMQIESFGGRLEFNERRARALESAVVYKPSTDDREQRPASPVQPRGGPVAPGAPGAPSTAEGPGQRSRRRRRRRGRRGGQPAAVAMGSPQPPAGQPPASPAAVADLGAREAGETHASTAERIEQEIAADSHPSEPSTHSASSGSTVSSVEPATGSEPGPSTGSGQGHDEG
jgi:hypothetical protein